MARQLIQRFYRRRYNHKKLKQALRWLKGKTAAEVRLAVLEERISELAASQKAVNDETLASIKHLNYAMTTIGQLLGAKVHSRLDRAKQDAMRHDRSRLLIPDRHMNKGRGSTDDLQKMHRRRFHL